MAMTIEERIVDIKTRIAAMKAKLSIEENLTKPQPSVNIQENVQKSTQPSLESLRDKLRAKR